MQTFLKNSFLLHKRTIYTVLFLFLYSISITFAVPPATTYNPGETLDPNCAPGDTNCYVDVGGGSLTNGNGTTANGSAIDLGGSLTSDVNINGANRDLYLGGPGSRLNDFFLYSDNNISISASDGSVSNSMTITASESIQFSSSDGVDTFNLEMTPGSAVVTGSGSFSGLAYSADYSANYTDRSLIDRGYANASYWNLAGTSTLTADTTIDIDGNNLNITDTSGVGNITFVSNSTLHLESSGGTELLLLGDTTPINIWASNNTLTLRADEILINTDGNTSHQGVVYPSDLSANYTNRSLIDKGYADTNYWKTDGDTTLVGDVNIENGGVLSIDGGQALSFSSQGAAMSFGSGATINMTFSSLYLDGIGSLPGTGDALCMYSFQVLVNSGATTCSVSSARFKHDITTISSSVLSIISSFKPSTFIYNGQTNERIGLIAEEVVQVEPRLVFYEEDGITPRGVRYEDLGVLVLKGVQELDIKVSSIQNFSDNTFKTSLLTWLGDMNNGLEKIFTKEIETQKICLSDATGSKTCITKSELDGLLLANPPQQPTPAPEPDPETIPETPTEETPEPDTIEE